ncbi:MAG: heat-inducible transcriptional repressor HrcA [Spirochaetota bacterium]
MDNRQNTLSEREAAVLGAIVYEYIMTGKPVGSRSFVHKYSFNLSPATMRNIMFDLETMGFLMQPHTSAGRVPTDRGYRYYVNNILDSYDIMGSDYTIREEMLTREIELDKLFVSITKMLSEMSKYAGIVLTPKPDFSVVKHIELVPLGNNVILFILVTRTGIIINKRIPLSKTLNQDELHGFSKFLTTELNGFSIGHVRTTVIQKLRKTVDPYSELQLALDILELALNEIESQDTYIEGIENIIRIPDMIEGGNIMPFLHLIEDRSILTFILERTIESEGVSTLIGDEIEDETVIGCSLVTSPYKIGNNHVGVVGIIGPTRMNYKTVVPLVDYTGRIVSDMLTKMSK